MTDRQPPVTWATDALVPAVGPAVPPRLQPPCACCIERPDGCRDDDLGDKCSIGPCRCRVADYGVRLWCDGCIVELGL